MIIRFSRLRRKTSNVMFIIIATIHIVLFHALRDPFVYPDNPIYAEAYDIIIKYDFNELMFGINQYTTWEKGYVVLNFLLGKISESNEILFITTSMIMVGGIMFLVYRWSYIPILTVLLYLLYPMIFYQSLFVIRQHIACTMILWTLYFIRNNKKWLMLFLLAFSFHYSAIIFLPFYFIRNINMENLDIKKLLIFGGIIAVVFRIVVGWVIGFFPRYEIYDKSENNVLPLLVLGSLLLMHIFNKTYALSDNVQDRNMIKFLTYGVFVSFFIIGLPGGGRLSNYFIYIMPFALPMLFKYNFRYNNIKVIYLMFILGLTLYVDYLSFFISDKPMLDYKLFWSI